MFRAWHPLNTNRDRDLSPLSFLNIFLSQRFIILLSNVLRMSRFILSSAGICTRCGEKVVGEGSGCTAMEQVYHIKCFVCIVCHLQLQGKPFYALDSKPYCEDCYLVSVCFLSVSILRNM